MSEINIPIPDTGGPLGSVRKVNQELNKIPTPVLYDLLRGLKTDIFRSINCVTLGTIESFNSTNQTASISINYKRLVGEFVNEYPLLINCPVMFLTGGIGTITLPIAKGDTCLVLFCDRDIDAWFETGIATVPPTDRTHDINDGFALVGIRSSLNFLADYNMDGIQAKHGIARLALEDENETVAEHGDSKLTLIDGDKAKLETPTAEVSVEDKVKIAVSGATLKTALDALCSALTAWVDTGGDTPNGATIAAINAAKALIDGVLK